MTKSIIQFYNTGGILFKHGLRCLLKIKDLMEEREDYEECGVILEVLEFFKINYNSEEALNHYTGMEQVDFKSLIDRIYDHEETQKGRKMYDTIFPEQCVTNMKSYYHTMCDIIKLKDLVSPLLYGLAYVMSCTDLLVNKFGLDMYNGIIDVKDRNIPYNECMMANQIWGFMEEFIRNGGIPLGLVDARRLNSIDYHMEMSTYIANGMRYGKFKSNRVDSGNK